MFGLDLSFFDLEMLRKFVLSGFIFSVQLTITATLGGIFFGTLLALMRLSGSRLLAAPATFYVNGMRSVPLVMVILWFYLLMPFVIVARSGPSGRPSSPLWRSRRLTSAKSCARASSRFRVVRCLRGKPWA